MNYFLESPSKLFQEIYMTQRTYRLTASILNIGSVLIYLGLIFSPDFSSSLNSKNSEYSQGLLSKNSLISQLGGYFDSTIYLRKIQEELLIFLLTASILVV